MFRSFAQVLGTNLKNARQTLSMAIIELKKTYSSSSFGIVWAIIKPALFVLVYWFGIQFGIRGGKADQGEPFILWLIAGILPWFFISEALVQVGTSIRRHRYLVTKSVFPVSTIPTFTEVSLFTVHLLLAAIATVIFAVTGNLTWGYFQIFYGMLCLFVLMWVLGLLFSALVVISRDFEYMLKSATQVLFWLSPILWRVDRIASIPWLYYIVRLNPITYVIEVYRDAFFGRLCFANTAQLACFWVEMTVGALLATFIYKRLEPEFADIL